MSHLYLVLLCLLVKLKNTASLECYHCTDIERLDSCHNVSQCQNEQSCYTNSDTNGQTRTFTLGCTDNQQCGTITDGSPGIVGRSIAERQTQQCHECCSTDHCNNLLCRHLKPTTCIDDAKIDCAFMNAMFNICQDIHHSKTVCPKFCKLCSLVDGNWAEWSQWSTCAVTCGKGKQTRKRTCTNPAPANNGLDCDGSDTEIKNCLNQPCPVHGGWTDWTEWGLCSVTCDVGTQKRSRKCSNPYPSRYGDHCFGDSMDDRICLPGPCANGGWSNWGSWTSCSATCGGGLHSQSRTCSNPRPSPLGRFCNGDTLKVEMCNSQKCPSKYIGFKAYSLDTNTPSTGHTLRFITVLFNEGNAYNSSTGKFTAPVTGMYSVSLDICPVSSTNAYIQIYVDSFIYSRSLIYHNSASSCNNLNTILYAKKGSKIYVVSKNDAQFINSGEYWNMFSGALLH